MSNEVICKNCGAVMYQFTEEMLLCPNCENEAYPDVEDPDYPGEIMQLMPEEDYDYVYDYSEFPDFKITEWEHPIDDEDF